MSARFFIVFLIVDTANLDTANVDTVKLQTTLLVYFIARLKQFVAN